jgi:hypothetical protein
MARHEIVVKWGDILMGRYFDEANFGRPCARLLKA